MASKRSATTDLNHDNWNEEKEPEEAGMFAQATEKELEKRRVLKAAKRRLSSRDGMTKSAFGTFAGFKTTRSTANPSPFSFLATQPSTSPNIPSLGIISTEKTSASNGPSPCPENGKDVSDGPSNCQIVLNVSPSKETSTKGDENIFKKSTDYYAKLKGLNESVTQWIKTHVDANPFCILSPIFQDYERYLKDIESKHKCELGTNVADKVQTTPRNDSTREATSLKKIPDNSVFGGSTTKFLTGTERKLENSVFGNISTNTKSIFGNTDQKVDNPKSIFGNNDQIVDTPKSIFGNAELRSDSKAIFGSNVTAENNPFLNKSSVTTDKMDNVPKSDVKVVSTSFPTSSLSTATFSFGASSTANNMSAGFSFGNAKPFSFGAQAVAPHDTDVKGENESKDDEDEEPPKPDFKPITEEGAIYEQRCKVFMKKDGEFSNRGIGTLFLKPTPNGKTQLIVRAETSLGLLLINTLLTENTPTQRMNRNTIMILCLPKPDSTPPPTPVLLRVKTSEEADVLLETLNKHKL